LCMALFITHNIHAQNKTEVETITFDFSQATDSAATKKGTVTVIGHDRNKAFYEKKLKQAKKKKIVGIVLASLGGAAIAGTIGGYFALKHKNETSGYSEFRDPDFLLQVGVPASVALLATGIPLSIIGSVKEKKYRKKLKEF